MTDPMTDRSAERAEFAHEQHHPWGPLEGALVSTLIDWMLSCKELSASGPGSDGSGLMDTALTRIKGLCWGVLDPEAVMTEIDEKDEREMKA